MRTREVKRGRAALVAAVAGLAIASAAHAQVRNWNNTLGGSWGVATNWNPNDVPDSGGESASISLPGTYTVALAGNYQVGSYSNTNATAGLNILGGFTLGTFGGLTNNGVMTINSTSTASSTGLQIISSQSLTGSGQIVLNAIPGNLDTAYITYNGGGEVLTHASGHTVRGTGRIYVAIANAGLIDADTAGRTLQLIGPGKSNTGTMRARSGGTLQISTDVNNTGGTIRADGGTVQFDTVSITGGSVDAINSGLNSIVGGPFFSGVTMSGPAAVQPGGNLRLTGPLVNNGTITVNPVGANVGTQMQAISTQPITGSGQIVLNASPLNLDTGSIYWNGGGEVLTNGPTHTIRGTGRIAVNVTNNGIISADSTARTLQLTSISKTNNNLMRATGGGILDIANIGITQSPSAQLVTVGPSTVSLSAGSVSGGIISTPAPGQLVSTGTSNINSVTFSGVAQVMDGFNLRTSDGFTNNGIITINPSGVNANTLIQCLSTCTINGTGTIILNANIGSLDSAYISYNGGGEVLTNTAGHTIRGTGRLYVSMINNGVIRADVTGRTLELNATGKVNNATITATNGGNLSVNSIPVTQNGPGIFSTATAGTLSFNAASVVGGGINTSAGGPATITNSSFDGVTFTGASNVAAGNAMRTSSGFNNNGTITINPTAVNTNSYLQFISTCGISGTGQIVLNANPANLDSAYLTYNGGGEVFTNTATHTIRGSGRIYVNVLNNGTISADSSGRTLEFLGANKTNNALVRATAGGRLQYTNFTMNQTATGRTVAEPASGWNLVGTSLSGGRMEVSPGGTGTYSGTNRLDSVALFGQQSIATLGNMQVTTGITNNGDLINNSVMQAISSFTLGGTGRLLLTAPVNDLNASYIIYNGGGEVVTNDVNHTIAGRGRVFTYCTNAGTISPGSAPGQSARIDFTSPLTFTPTGLLDIEIGGDTEFDTITSTSSVALGNGRLRVRTYNAYTPNYNQTFDIITCNSRTGVFADIDAPGFQVEYLADRVRLRVICDGDFNQDGNVDQGDVDFLINVIAGGGTSPFLSPDFNRDGNVDQGDIDALINVIAGGACQQ